MLQNIITASSLFRLIFACMNIGGAGFIASHVVRLLHNKYPHYKVAAPQEGMSLKPVICCYLPCIATGTRTPRCLQIIVLDKLDYCSSVKNLAAFKGKNYKVCSIAKVSFPASKQLSGNNTDQAISVCLASWTCLM